MYILFLTFLCISGAIGPLEIRSTKSYLVPGDTLEMSCNNPQGNFGDFEWTKLNGYIPRNAQILGPKLRLNNMQISDRGIYRCSFRSRSSQSIYADFVVDFQGYF